MIAPIPPNVAAATVKSVGSIGSALIGRYRPAGVPRTGSTEDRAIAYRRLLDSSTRSFAYTYMNNHMNREGGWAGKRYLIGQISQGWEISAELIGSLHGVRLCGTAPVIAAAEDLVSAAGDMNYGETDAAVFQEAADDVATAQRIFLDACRADLAYNTRWYQVGRRRAERKFLSQQALPAAIEA